MHHEWALEFSLMCRNGVGACRLGAWTRSKLLPGPLGHASQVLSLHSIVDLIFRSSDVSGG